MHLTNHNTKLHDLEHLYDFREIFLKEKTPDEFLKIIINAKIETHDNQQEKKLNLQKKLVSLCLNKGAKLNFTYFEYPKLEILDSLQDIILNPNLSDITPDEFLRMIISVEIQIYDFQQQKMIIPNHELNIQKKLISLCLDKGAKLNFTYFEYPKLEILDSLQDIILNPNLSNITPDEFLRMIISLQIQIDDSQQQKIIIPNHESNIQKKLISLCVDKGVKINIYHFARIKSLEMLNSLKPFLSESIPDEFFLILILSSRGELELRKNLLSICFKEGIKLKSNHLDYTTLETLDSIQDIILNPDLSEITPDELLKKVLEPIKHLPPKTLQIQKELVSLCLEKGVRLSLTNLKESSLKTLESLKGIILNPNLSNITPDEFLRMIMSVEIQIDDSQRLKSPNLELNLQEKLVSLCLEKGIKLKLVHLEKKHPISIWVLQNLKIIILDKEQSNITPDEFLKLILSSTVEIYNYSKKKLITSQDGLAIQEELVYECINKGANVSTLPLNSLHLDKILINCTKHYLTLPNKIINLLKNNGLSEEETFRYYLEKKYFESIDTKSLNLKIKNYLTKRIQKIEDWGKIFNKADCQETNRLIQFSGKEISNNWNKPFNKTDCHVNNKFFHFTYKIDGLHQFLAQKITKSIIKSTTLLEVSTLLSYANIRHFLYNYLSLINKINDKVFNLVEKIITIEELIESMNFANTAFVVRYNDKLNNHVKIKFLNFFSKANIYKDIILKIFSSEAFCIYYANYQYDLLIAIRDKIPQAVLEINTTNEAQNFLWEMVTILMLQLSSTNITAFDSKLENDMIDKQLFWQEITNNNSKIIIPSTILTYTTAKKCLSKVYSMHKNIFTFVKSIKNFIGAYVVKQGFNLTEIEQYNGDMLQEAKQYCSNQKSFNFSYPYLTAITDTKQLIPIPLIDCTYSLLASKNKMSKIILDILEKDKYLHTIILYKIDDLSEGFTHSYKGLNFIQIDKPNNTPCIMHELTHAFMYKIFDNNANPYFNHSLVQEQNFNQLIYEVVLNGYLKINSIESLSHKTNLNKKDIYKYDPSISKKIFDIIITNNGPLVFYINRLTDNSININEVVLPPNIKVLDTLIYSLSSYNQTEYHSESIARYFQLLVDPKVNQVFLQEISQPLAHYTDELLKNVTDIN